MIQEINKISRVSGELKLPGDKSISHRSVMFSALAKGESKISNLLESADINSTISCFQHLGCTIVKNSEECVVNGNGLFGLKQSNNNLDAGNSGTTARLISGVLSMQKFNSVLIGDDSLSKRPMRRVTDPLLLMGAKIKLSDQGTLPAFFNESKETRAIKYELPVASAQVKSAVLLAGLHLEEETQVIESFQTRDHTERMLNCSYAIEGDKKIISVSQKKYPEAKEYIVPSDISTASFFIVLTLLSKGSELLLKNVSLNPTRTGILKVLQLMGANIKLENIQTIAGEELGDIFVKSSDLKNVEIEKELIPNIIDEIPILSIAGLFAEGTFSIRGAEELRVKESDRISSMCVNFKKLGLNITEYDDGFDIEGEIQNTNPVFESFHDHRIAMAFAILSSLTFESAKIKDFECVAISNPQFINQLRSISN